jgi:glyoxylase-like metal-dependent hydrolase (beta-lactamase superfamily II)
MKASDEDWGLLGSRLSRRQLLQAGALAVGAASLGLVACEDGEEAAPEITPSSAASPTPGPLASATPPGSSIVSIGGDPAGIREVAPDTIFFPYFGNVIALRTDEGTVLVDTSLAGNGEQILEELRKRTEEPVHTIIYTHGHYDHVGGTDSFVRDAEERGHPRPRVIGHARVPDRFRRYERMAGWTKFINSIQFGVPIEAGFEQPPKPSFVYPDETYDESMTLEVGGERFELLHGIGETDDHTWVWAPERNLACAGDFFIWACPNVGNPWKVQRYAEGWAEGLEAIAAKRPAMLLPGHGPVIEGEEDVQTKTLNTARYLRSIHDQVVERMNRGQWLEQILREVEPPSDLLSEQYLQPIYGHPTFIIHGVWRQYGGWYDGDPADFFPSPTDAQAKEMVGLAGGDRVLARARELHAAGDVALACHLADWVRKAEPANLDAWQLWKELFEARAAVEPNMMARNIFKGAAAEAQKHMG